jgi:hypothetical protein
MDSLHLPGEAPYQYRSRGLGQAVDELRQTALQVRSLVAVNAAALGELVDHTNDFRQELTRFRTQFQAAQVFDRRAGRFFVVAVLQAALAVLTDTL